MRVGLALGGGGAKGLAHIPILEAFDEAGVRPHRIAGTSIGAVLGAMYAAGKSAAEIRADVERTVPHGEDSFREIFKKLASNGITRILGINFRSGSILSPGRIEAFFAKAVGVTRFERLAIPLRVVAADFWSRDEVVFEQGNLPAAIRASTAIPGLFAPVRREGRILVDGGGVNPLPFDLLQRDCDVVVAVDVSGQRVNGSGGVPGTLEALVGMFQVMSASLVEARLRVRAPDLLLRPEVGDVRVLEFWKARAVLEGAANEKERCLEWLRGLPDDAKTGP